MNETLIEEVKAPSKPDLEIGRAIWHSVSIILCAVLAGLVPTDFGLWLLLTAVGAVSYWEIRRYSDPSYNFADYRFFKTVLRDEEIKGRRSTGLDYLLALLIIYLLLPVPMLQVTLCMVGVADPAARICGRAWGRRKLFFSSRKTLVGSFGCFVSAAVIGLMASLFVGVDWRLPLLGAAMAVVAEAVPSARYLPADNFWMTLLTGLLMYWAQLGVVVLL